jgi:diadenosine tetraphosphatase ApaH/serine/threonine PP2A family protein phosphatase
MRSLRTLIVSDTHSNLEGLLAVIAHANARGGIDALWCAGDIVGYGAEPSAVIAELRARGVQSVAGNHDRAATGRMDIEDFNPIAAEAANWTRDAITAADGEWLDELPLTLTIGDFTIVHGSLREPLWEYLDAPPVAGAQFDLQQTPYSIVGHLHVQFWCEERDGEWPLFHVARDGERITLGETRLILNPGSSGQPRDGDPRAGYMLYDDAARTIEWHRVEYDAEAAGAKILAGGLPEALARRLLVGR